MYYHYSRIKSFLFSLILLLTVSVTYGQVYPVQVTVVPTPPHRNYLNSFSEQGALSIFLTLTDFNSGAISVKLKMELNGSGYQFRSLPNNLVYVLNPGQPVQIPQEDLAVFFSSSGQTLNFNPSKLPEGNTSICVDVVKNQSGELLSNNGCGYFYMGFGQPASLLQPACNSTVQIPIGFPTTTDLRTIPLQFNFIPPIAPMGLQQEVENTLYIYNWLGTINTNPPVSPVGLSLAVDPIELGQITAHTLLPINNQLIVGQEYVWYVKSTLNGSTNQFQNGGWSAPCKFKYGLAQSIEETLAQGLSVEWIDLASQSESKGTASWQVVKEDPNSSATFNQFILKYRRKVPVSEEPFEWFSDTVNDLSKAIYQLEPATTYEASVAGRLGNFVSEPTEVRTFTTAPPRTYSCGVANFPGRATAFQPLSYADPGMKVKIGMFQLEFVSVQSTGQPGHFSGTGLIPIDFLFGAEARVKFSDLKIDKEYDVWAGTAYVITDGLDVWLEEQYQQFQEPIYVNGTIDSAYVSDSLAHIIIDGVDTTFTFPCATCPVIINDVAGNQVTIYPNGTVVWSTYLDVSDEQLNVPDSEIAVFEQNDETTANKGGFDPFEHIEWNANYEIIRTNNAVNYFVGNKSFYKNQGSKINVSVPADKYNATNVKLSWEGLANPLSPVSSSISNSKRIYIFNLPAFSNKENLSIYAVSDNLKIGKLNAKIYEPIQKNVVVVPISGTVNENDLSTYLNNTFGESGIELTVSISDTLGVGKYANSSALNIPDATLLTKYSEKMRKIRNDYFDKHELGNNTYYLFIVSSLTDTVNNQSTDGYMVRGKSIGFIQSGASFHTYAHELGHGMGGLEHSWKDNGPQRGSTNNLMDYTEGVNLTLAQWELLRNPKGNSLWDEEEDYLKQGGVLAYYIWIEKLKSDVNDLHGEILNADVITPLKTNYKMLISSDILFNQAYNSYFSNEDVKDVKTVLYEFHRDHPNGLHGDIYSSVLKEVYRDLKSVIYYYNENTDKWQSILREPVMYFSVKPTGNGNYKKDFMFASEYVELTALNQNIKVKAQTHYIVKKFLNQNGSFNHYEVLTYDGADVTSQFTSTTTNPPKRYLVFSNGYRGPMQNIDESDGVVTTNDRYGYWTANNFGKMMIDRLKAKGKTYYIDGSYRIWTSNHVTMGAFATSLLDINSKYLDYASGVDTNPYQAIDDYLNIEPNVDGFNYRKYQGRLAGKAFLAQIKKDPRSVGVKDTIDIVAHSMGYAYAVGFAEEIKNEVHFGRFYIFAPENACSGGNDWNMFEEVWQYGANNNASDSDAANCLTVDGTRDPYFWQDGIAPQCEVQGIGQIVSTIPHGRVYIPKSFSEKGFNPSHYIMNYTWVFTMLQNGDEGYIKSR